MFTGIIESVSLLKNFDRDDHGLELSLDLGKLANDAQLGDSIAVNGICLTIASLESSMARFALSPETLERTTAKEWQEEQCVNIEAALRFGDHLGGHLVSGHVDGVGKLLARETQGDYETFRFTLPEDSSIMVVEKGSITIDGISLTTNECHDNSCSIAVIPHTLENTNLKYLKKGDAVNMEQDLIGRWVGRLLDEQK